MSAWGIAPDDPFYPEPPDEPEGWRCECGDWNMEHEAFCYRCGAGPTEAEPESEPETAGREG